MEGKVPVTVLVMTKNEELNLRFCLDSVKWANEIIIVDSHSTDKTLDIAREYTDKIYQYPSDASVPKKHWSLVAVKFSYDWILMLDADERATVSFKTELAKMLDDGSSEFSGYIVKYNYLFLGRYIKFGDPVRKLSLFRKSKTHFEQFSIPNQEIFRILEVGHEHPIVSGRIGKFNAPLLHADLRPLSFYIERHNLYSTWEAEVLFRKLYSCRDDKVCPQIIGNYLELRRLSKLIFLRLPFKSLFYFFYSYILRLGFLDGYPGFSYNVCKSIYAYYIGLKLYEFKLKTRKDL